ncbi:hypothetical protein PENTCL1PPCAC_14166 [Pristionchus entomophagus]|uniref:G protein-coupled receptor n=1 Tax=Pristionchus entomophagus TaxID=358040 RepID=A0AAV5T8T6_9BILA|nr:hypothetical protein PENTCL1PPCAC_14166 [Pristionchus entomophagus]
MEFHLAVTNCVGGFSTIVNGLFVILIFVTPPDNLGIFRSQYYAGAIASFLYAAMQFWTAIVSYADGTLYLIISARNAGAMPFLVGLAAFNWQFMMLSSNLAAQYAAIRGGWIRYYLSNKALFYTVQLLGIVFSYIPPIILISPSSELRLAQARFFLGR